MKRIQVETNKRAYTVIGPGIVPWERGEKVVSIEPVPDPGKPDDTEENS